MASRHPKFEPRAVFINCPFDKLYKPIFDAIVFAIHDLGFVARHALIDDSSPVRLERIVNEIQRAKYSVHDLSRVESSGVMKLPRFNMPFEAGLAYCVQALDAPGRRHFLLLDAEPYRYQASLSDAGGLDPKIHKNDPQEAIAAIRQFLSTKSGQPRLPGASQIGKRFVLFKSLLPRLLREIPVSAAEIRSWDYVNLMQYLMATWIGQNPP